MSEDRPAFAAQPGPIIRDATTEDLTAIRSIYAHNVEHGLGSFELEVPSRSEMRRRFDSIRASRLPFLVAVEDGEVLGYAYAGPYRARPAYRFTAEDSVYVWPHAQGRGIGSALLQRLLEQLRAGGVRQVVAVIGDSENRSSVALHRKLGFGHVGILRSVGWKHGRWVDTVLMQLQLEARGSDAGP